MTEKLNSSGLATTRFAERMAGFTKARNVLTGESPGSVATLQLPAKTAVKATARQVIRHRWPLRRPVLSL